MVRIVLMQRRLVTKNFLISILLKLANIIQPLITFRLNPNLFIYCVIETELNLLNVHNSLYSTSESFKSNTGSMICVLFCGCLAPAPWCFLNRYETYYLALKRYKFKTSSKKAQQKQFLSQIRA